MFEGEPCGDAIPPTGKRLATPEDQPVPASAIGEHLVRICVRVVVVLDEFVFGVVTAIGRPDFTQTMSGFIFNVSP